MDGARGPEDGRAFATALDLSRMFLGRGQQEALARLLYTVLAGRGIAILAGEFGVGKTTIASRVRSELEARRIAVAWLPAPPDSAVDLLREVIRCLAGKAARGSCATLRARVAKLLGASAACPRLVIVVDDAQRMTSRSILDELAFLRNLREGADCPVGVVLVGHTELRERVREHALLRERTACLYVLRGLDTAEVKAFIATQLAADGKRPRFTDEAVDAVARYSLGRPRHINSLCDLAALMAMSEGAPEIDIHTIERSATELIDLLPSEQPAERSKVGRSGMS